MATSTSPTAGRPPALFIVAGALFALTTFAIAGYMALAAIREPVGQDAHHRWALVANLLVSGLAVSVGVLTLLRRGRLAVLVLACALAALAWNIALRP